MNAARNIVTVAVVSICLAAPAWADWDPIPVINPTNHKMHYPQMPDPYGWDVQCSSPTVLADDWRCSQAGPVSDIHLWGSVQDAWGSLADIQSIHVSIHDNVPADPDDPLSYSHPRQVLWERDFYVGDFSVRDYGTGEQGWYDPTVVPPTVIQNDHTMYHQINIVDIEKPFPQELGKIYWLDVSVTTVFGLPFWGWKTSVDHFMDDAVYEVPGEIPGWRPLKDPFTNETLDLAFVITPEPATAMLLAVGGGLLVLRRRRRRR